MKKRATDKKTGTMYTSPRGMRYEFLPTMGAVKLSTIVPMRAPTDVQIWKVEIMSPLYRAGALSWM